MKYGFLVFVLSTKLMLRVNKNLLTKNQMRDKSFYKIL